MKAGRSHFRADELGRPLSSAELAIAAKIRHSPWHREPSSDRRIRRGDDYAGDAWRNVHSGELRHVGVGQRPECDARELALDLELAQQGTP
jgi:hypothetical protein